jgi:dTDP-glucose pyrophosphorylase
MLSATSTLQQAIQNLDASTLQIILVVADDGFLVGTLTDGDIRRGLLRGMDLNSSIETIVTREPLLAPSQWGYEMVLQLMQVNKIHQMPIVDEHRRVVGLHLLNELMAPARRPNLMLFMAGGLGTRLRPHTERCPKPMLPVGGKPILEHLINRARGEGFQHFAIATHFLGHVIEEYFGDGSRWNITIQYIREESPLGTAGAVALLKPRPDAPFLVSNGDVLTDIKYAELLDFHCRDGALATMAVRRHEWQHPFGVVHTRGVEIIGFEEKPIARTHINAGIYVLDPSAIDTVIPGQLCDMPTIFDRIRDQGGRTIVYPMHEPWLDIGSPADYSAAQGSHGGDAP